MANWGALLLAAFVALGLIDRLTWRQGGRYAVMLTAVVLVYEFAAYGGLR